MRINIHVASGRIAIYVAVALYQGIKQISVDVTPQRQGGGMVKGVNRTAATVYF